MGALVLPVVFWDIFSLWCVLARTLSKAVIPPQPPMHSSNSGSPRANPGGFCSLAELKNPGGSAASTSVCSVSTFNLPQPGAVRTQRSDYCGKGRTGKSAGITLCKSRVRAVNKQMQLTTRALKGTSASSPVCEHGRLLLAPGWVRCLPRVWVLIDRN